MRVQRCVSFLLESAVSEQTAESSESRCDDTKPRPGGLTGGRESDSERSGALHS